MRIITLVLAILVSSEAFAQALTVSNITFDGISHSVVRATFAASGQYYWLRTRYIQSPGTCTGGTGGDVQGSSYGPLNARVYNAISWDGMNVAIIDSYLDNLEYFHSVYSGLGLAKVN